MEQRQARSTFDKKSAAGVKMKSKTMLGAEYPLIIISEYMQTPEKLISVQMNADVKHGLLSVRYTGFKFTLDKDNYSFGETIKL